METGRRQRRQAAVVVPIPRWTGWTRWTRCCLMGTSAADLAGNGLAVWWVLGTREALERHSIGTEWTSCGHSMERRNAKNSPKQAGQALVRYVSKYCAVLGCTGRYMACQYTINQLCSRWTMVNNKVDKVNKSRPWSTIPESSILYYTL